MIRLNYSRGAPVRVSVLTPTIPERAAMLAEAKASVAAQTFRGHEHLILVDAEREGCAATVNKLAEHAKGDWLLILADDDLLLPNCLQALVDTAAANTNGHQPIVYPRPLVWGRHPAGYWQSPPNIPSLALIPTGLWRELGGYQTALAHEEDNDLWHRALALNVPFVEHASTPTWAYRFHGSNKSDCKRRDAHAH